MQFSCSHLKKDTVSPKQSSCLLERLILHHEFAYLLVTRNGSGTSTRLTVIRRALDNAVKSQRTSLTVVTSSIVLTILQRKETERKLYLIITRKQTTFCSQPQGFKLISIHNFSLPDMIRSGTACFKHLSNAC